TGWMSHDLRRMPRAAPSRRLRGRPTTRWRAPILLLPAQAVRDGTRRTAYGAEHERRVRTDRFGARRRELSEEAQDVAAASRV
ncbi:MAG: hypothetical protein L0H26_07405, partial [Microlunatus sp.]|nr:hypothetical protein [Microlunatus sp.]